MVEAPDSHKKVDALEVCCSCKSRWGRGNTWGGGSTTHCKCSEAGFHTGRRYTVLQGTQRNHQRVAGTVRGGGGGDGTRAQLVNELGLEKRDIYSHALKYSVNYSGVILAVES